MKRKYTYSTVLTYAKKSTYSWTRTAQTCTVQGYLKIGRFPIRSCFPAFVKHRKTRNAEFLRSWAVRRGCHLRSCCPLDRGDALSPAPQTPSRCSPDHEGAHDCYASPSLPDRLCPFRATQGLCHSSVFSYDVPRRAAHFHCKYLAVWRSLGADLLLLPTGLGVSRGSILPSLTQFHFALRLQRRLPGTFSFPALLCQPCGLPSNTTRSRSTNPTSERPPN